MHCPKACRPLRSICAVRCFKMKHCVKRLTTHLILNGRTNSSRLMPMCAQTAILKIRRWSPQACLKGVSWKFWKPSATSYRLQSLPKSLKFRSQMAVATIAAICVSPNNCWMRQVTKPMPKVRWSARSQTNLLCLNCWLPIPMHRSNVGSSHGNKRWSALVLSRPCALSMPANISTA